MQASSFFSRGRPTQEQDAVNLSGIMATLGDITNHLTTSLNDTMVSLDTKLDTLETRVINTEERQKQQQCLLEPSKKKRKYDVVVPPELSVSAEHIGSVCLNVHCLSRSIYFY